MCGIVGKAVRSGQGVQLAEGTKVRAVDSISHRGPDRQGSYSDKGVWLGHARLSIIDLSDNASQPMATSDGRFVISYNGEVYNFRELAKELDGDGLRSHSDSEVVLRTFARLGPASLRLLNGMFAFALYDSEARKIWLARDRLGIKPLYYRLDWDSLSFASEIGTLLLLQGQAAKSDCSAIHEWLYYGTSLGERTLYSGIRKLLPGHFLELDLDTFTSRTERYWSPVEYSGGKKDTGALSGRIQQAKDLLEQAVRRQLVSDVPVGVFLSGGIDSSAITAFASRHYGGKLATYSVGFDFTKGVDELPKARRIAELFCTDHHELHVSGYEIADVVEEMVDSHNTPFSDAANIPLYLLASRIKGSVKVVLQGDGGDEMFGGYSRYTTLSWLRSARTLGRFASLANYLLPHSAGYYRRKRYLNALREGDPALIMALLLTEEDAGSNPTAVFGEEFRRRVSEDDPFVRYRECQRYFADEDPVNQMLFIDAMIILPDIFLEKVDRSTMAASLEVRVPFLDNDLVDFCFHLSGPQKVRFGKKKWLLKKALKGVVPDDILYGKKTGFSVPYGDWLRDALKPLFFDQLQTFERRHPRVLSRGSIVGLYADHASRKRDRSFLLWKVLNFMIWANRSGVAFSC